VPVPQPGTIMVRRRRRDRRRRPGSLRLGHIRGRTRVRRARRPDGCPRRRYQIV